MELRGPLFPLPAYAKSGTGSTRSCTGRGFSCGARGAIAFATITIADDAVVSYTTFSPVSRIHPMMNTGCVFSVILSVPAGYCLQNPRFPRQWRARGAPCPRCSDFPPRFALHETERLPEEPSSASGCNVQPSQHNFLNSTARFSPMIYCTRILFFESIPRFAN